MASRFGATVQAAVTARAPETKCAFDTRLPASLLGCIFALLSLEEHALLSAASRRLRGIALLPEASCPHLRLAYTTSSGESGRLFWESHQVPAALRIHRPRSARIFGQLQLRAMDPIVAWLSLAPQRLVTLVLSVYPNVNMTPLAAVTSLQNLVMAVGSSECVLAGALSACGSRLRTLRLLSCRIDSLSQAAPLALPAPPLVHAGESIFKVATVAQLLAGCTLLEALLVQSDAALEPDLLTDLAAVHLPALRSLTFAEGGPNPMVVSDIEHFATCSGLTALSYHNENVLFRRPIKWPTLSCLVSLDVGLPLLPDDTCAVLFTRFPRLARLRLAATRCPNNLSLLTTLGTLTLVDSAAVPASGYLQELAAVWPRLPRLTRLAVSSAIVTPGVFAAWELPRVTHLLLDLRADSCPNIQAPALVELQVRRVNLSTVVDALARSPRLERILCEAIEEAPDMEKRLAALVARVGGRARVIRGAEMASLAPEFSAAAFESMAAWLSV